jgi:hypothetical protein
MLMKTFLSVGLLSAVALLTANAQYSYAPRYVYTPPIVISQGGVSGGAVTGSYFFAESQFTTASTNVSLKVGGDLPAMNAAALTNLPIVSFTNGSILYVATNGDNETAVKGMREKPWKLVSYAVSNAVAGDIVMVTAGTYNETNIYALPFVTIRGEGQEISRIKVWGPQEGIRLQSGCTLENLYAEDATAFGSHLYLINPINGTNTVRIKNVTAIGNSDCLYVGALTVQNISLPANVEVDSCAFYSSWDCVNGFATEDSIWIIKNSILTTTNNPANSSRKRVIASNTRAKMFVNGCYVRLSTGISVGSTFDFHDATRAYVTGCYIESASEIFHDGMGRLPNASGNFINGDYYDSFTASPIATDLVKLRSKWGNGISLVATNISTPYTNGLLVTSAGTAAANGFYKFAWVTNYYSTRLNAYEALWTNLANGYQLVYSEEDEVINALGSQWQIRNGDTELYYSMEAVPTIAGWAASGGAGTPTVSSNLPAIELLSSNPLRVPGATFTSAITNTAAWPELDLTGGTFVKPALTLATNGSVRATCWVQFSLDFLNVTPLTEVRLVLYRYTQGGATNIMRETFFSTTSEVVYKRVSFPMNPNQVWYWNTEPESANSSMVVNADASSIVIYE